MPFDWSALLDKLPMALAGRSPGMMQGFTEAMQRIQQQKLQQQQLGLQQHSAQRQDELAQAQIQNLTADNQRSDAQLALQRILDSQKMVQPTLDALVKTPETALPAGTGATEAQNALTIQRFQAQRAMGVPAGTPQGPLPNMTQAVSEGKKRRAKAFDEQFMKQYGDQAPDAATSMRLHQGEFAGMSPAEIRALYTDLPYGPAGKKTPAVPGSFEDYLSKQYGQSATAAQIIGARKTYQQAGSTAQPTSGGTPADIKPGTPAFKTAQDLAYGRLTFPGFRTLLAYNRDANFKLSLYAKAGELNPNFNPASFEMGLKLASDPQTQKQLASMDNAIQAAPDLIAASDKAARSGATVVNKYGNPIKIAIGNKRFSNLRTAQLAFADELSGALGFGSATDMKLQLGIDMTDPTLSPANLASAINDIVLPFVNRKRSTLLNQMGTYGTKEFNPAANAPAPGASPAAAGTPRIGERRRFPGGDVGQWDGTGWRPVQPGQ